MTKKHNPRFCITFHIKNLPLAERILQLIGYGFIRIKSKENACVLTISPVKGLKIILSLLSGNIKTPKLHQVNQLILWLNKHHNLNIKLEELSSIALQNNSWLSGFSDADGSFYIRHTTLIGGVKERIACRFTIEQRLIDPVSKVKYKEICQEICDFFLIRLHTRLQKSTNNSYYVISASSKRSLLIILDYFKNNPLYSSKYLDYKDWEHCCELIIEGNHKDKKYIETIDKLKSNMNKNRKNFNWDHLNNLPERLKL